MQRQRIPHIIKNTICKVYKKTMFKLRILIIFVSMWKLYLLKFCIIKKLHFWSFFGAGGGSRTHMKLPSMDFESIASAIPPHQHIFFYFRYIILTYFFFYCKFLIKIFLFCVNFFAFFFCHFLSVFD